MPDYCPSCGAELEAGPPPSGLLADVLSDAPGTAPAAEARVRRALEYMAEPKHQPRKGTWSRIHFETVAKLLRGEQTQW